MISLFEQRDQLAALQRRREEVSAQQASAAVTLAAAPVTGGLAGAVAGAGYAPATAAFKAGEPDIAKRRKGRDRGKDSRHLKGRDLETDPPTDAHESAQAGDSEHAAKNFRDRGISEGPGDSREPGRVDAEEFDRRYLESGHASEAPMSGARQMPIVHAPQGHVQPIELPGALVAGYVPAHVTQALSMGSPSDR